MHILTELQSGFAAAPSGYAEIKVRGTAQDATVYSDPEGLSERAGTQYTLDADGRLEVYVDEQVEIYVYTSAGTLVVGPHTNLTGDAAVEAVSTSFTGTSREDASTGASKPTTLRTILNLVKTKFGSLDFDLQKDVASTPATWTPKRLSITVGTAFVNVKDPTYGAKGDGSTDDTSAIQAAINAVEAAGGGTVIFPPGTYKTTAALVMDTAGTTLLGFGRPIIDVTSTTVNGITITAESHIQSIKVRCAEASASNSTGTGISISGAARSSLTDVDVLRSPTTDYTFGNGLNVLSSSDGVRIRNGKFQGTTAAIFAQTVDDLLADGIDCSPSADANVTLDDCTDAKIVNADIAGNVVLDDATGACLVHIVGSRLSGDLTVDSNARIRESGNKKMGGTVTNNSTREDNLWTSLVDNYRGTHTIDAATQTFVMWTMHDVWSLAAGVGSTLTTITVTSGWQDGATLTLLATGAITITDNSGNINLDGAASFVMADGDALQLVHYNGEFYEIGRCNTG